MTSLVALPRKVATRPGVNPAAHNISGGESVRAAPAVLGVMTLILFAFETLLTSGFLAGKLGTTAFLVAHVCCCLIFAAIGIVSEWRSGADGVFTTRTFQIVLWTLMAGPFGVAVSAVFLLPAAPARIGADAASDEDEAVLPEPTDMRLERIRTQFLDDRVRVSRIDQANGVRPLIDVISEGSRNEKLEALAVVARGYHPSLAVAIKCAMMDGDASVRVLAATVMAKLHGRFTQRIGALQDVRGESTSVTQLCDLAEARLDYAESGLMEAPRSRSEARQAEAVLAQAELADTGEENVLRIARLRRRVSKRMAGGLPVASPEPVTGSGEP
ncbi:MAG: hypothetical protein KDJ47_09360 [Hyphomicrobiaceae bacterium]|nr:hypothetical protein [Hyphomicrobiaceae bacterium]